MLTTVSILIYLLVIAFGASLTEAKTCSQSVLTLANMMHIISPVNLT